MTPRESCEKEVSRFFNKYYKFCESSDPDDLKELLATLCSSFEKLGKATNQRFKNNERFLALKALRNFSTHESELLNESKALELRSSTKVRFDVQIMCLIPIVAIDYVLDNLKSNFTRKCIRESFIYYKSFVDIYPALFNVSVDLYFLAKEHSLAVDGEGFSLIARAIQYEREHGYPHFIDGRIIMLNGSDINEFIENEATSIEDKNLEKSLLPTDENGLYEVSSLYSTSLVEQFALMKNEEKKHIFDQLLATKGIELRIDESEKYVVHMTRILTPIEIVIAHQHVESLNNRT